MQYKCNECNDTGSRDKSGDYLDCGHCDAAIQRKALNDWLASQYMQGAIAKVDSMDAWLVHQRALAMAPKQEAPTQAPIAWLVFAEDHNGMTPQHPPSATRLEATRYAAMFGQTPTEVRPLYEHVTPAFGMAPRQWVAIKDSAWVNIVNHDHAYDGWDKDDIINHVFKLTEAKCKELNGPDAAPAAANGAMPELPEIQMDHLNVLAQHYTADQMRAYGHACHAAGPDAALVECTHEMLCAAMKAAVATKIIASHADEETYLRNWSNIKIVINAALSGAKGN